MRALVAEQPGGPEVLEIQQLAIPEPGSGEVRIRVAYAALNPLDCHARADRIGWNAPTFPFTPGYEYSGIVDAVGEGGDPEMIGQRMISRGCWLGCADYAIAPVHSLVPVPEGFEWPLATVFHTCALSAWHILHTTGRLRASDTVLLHSAAGPVGLMATQIAKEAGATVIGLCSANKIDFARPFGADHLIDARGDWLAELAKVTDGRGADVIYDGVAGPDSANNHQALAPLGQVIYLGAVAGPPPPVDISRELYAKTIAVRGFVVYVAMAATQGAELPEIHDALRSGRWQIPITRTEPLENAAELHRAFEAREIFGKAVIRVGGDL